MMTCKAKLIAHTFVAFVGTACVGPFDYVVTTRPALPDLSEKLHLSLAGAPPYPQIGDDILIRVTLTNISEEPMVVNCAFRTAYEPPPPGELAICIRDSSGMTVDRVFWLIRHSELDKSAFKLLNPGESCSRVRNETDYFLWRPGNLVITGHYCNDGRDDKFGLESVIGCVRSEPTSLIIRSAEH
jgi:hypothetical protein